MNYILFDGPFRNNLLPFTFTRPVADLRIGILTIREKWETFLDTTTTTVTEDYLSDKYPMVEMDENVMINASYLPNFELIEMVKDLKENQAIFKDDHVIAFFTKETQDDIDFATFEAIEFNGDILIIENTWDIFAKNAEAIQDDFNLITKDRKSQPIPSSNNVIAPENIFLEEGAKLEFTTLNASNGPIYIGKNAEIMEGSIIRGALA
ncbi:MAG: putative sugar nucleotidyl transferase, partial [Flavobacteriaceae bacterium]